MNIFLIGTLFFTLANCAPVDNDEVELIPPVKSNSEDIDESESGSGFIPILVIRRNRYPSFSSIFNQFPLFGTDGQSNDAQGFPFNSEELPFEFGSDEETIPDVKEDFPDIFSSIFEDDNDEQQPLCGFLCSFLTNFEKKLKVLTDEVKTLHEMSENNHNDDEFDVNNSTYSEKVLPDGTVVRVNRTVISDTSEDGSSFFYHSTSFHNVGFGNDEETDETEYVNEDAEIFDEFPISSSTTESPLPDVPLLEDYDNLENEIPQDSDLENNEENVGIDDGLVKIGIA